MRELVSQWKKDLPASVVVFLVALPLCMGIALASGAPPARGLITGIIGGLVVGFLAGCPLQVSGPAAGLAVIVWECIEKFGLESLGVLVLGCGIFQFVAGQLGLGRWFQAVSPAVIKGMLAGIGLLIFASQFHVMVDDSPKGGGWANISSLPGAVMKGVMPTENTTHHLAAMIGLTTLVVIVAWNYLRPKSLKLVPAPLVAIVVATVAAWTLPISRVKVPANLGDVVAFPTFSNLSFDLMLAALAMAFIASAETLLCATAVDALHDGPRTNYDQELRAQGVGNLLCGLVGALPMTGVIVRSSANIEAGGKSRLSAILHGVWLLAFVALLPFVLEMIPTAALAAVLVYIGYRLVDLSVIKKLKQYGWGEVGVYVATLTVIVFDDLLHGVLVGLGLAMLRLVYNLSHLEVRSDDNGRDIDLHLEGAATFVSLPRLASALEGLPTRRRVRVHLNRLHLVDHACVELLTNFDRLYTNGGGELEVEWNELTSRTNLKVAS